MNEESFTASDVALVFEGGGLRNSYTAPFVVKLLSENFHVGWVGGLSAGASHTVNFLSADSDRARTSFVEFGANPKSGGFGSIVRGRGYFDAEYVYEIASQPDNDLPLDTETLFADPTPFAIETVRADTGETIRLGREDLTTPEALFKYIRASSTLPGMMAMPVIDGIPYVDGAIGNSGGLMIGAAEDAGFERFAVVLTRPREFYRKPVRYPEMLQRVFRRHPAVAELMISRHERYNAAKDHIVELERQGKAKVFYPETMPVTNSERRLNKLKNSYALGEDQVNREWEGWREFLTSS